MILEPRPQCGHHDEPVGQLGQLWHYCCRACGWWYTS